jgi:ribonuclease Z
MKLKIITNALEDDPFVLVESLDRRVAFLFDCGLRVRGNYRRIRKLKAILVTHAHIDHLIGFDHILRSMLSETAEIDIYGPPGFLGKLTGRIRSYDWDRAHEQNVRLGIHEIREGEIHGVTLSSADRFLVDGEQRVIHTTELVYENDYFIRWALLRHGGSPCLGYALRVRSRWRIRKAEMRALGLSEGPWVGRLLRALEREEHPGDLGPGAPEMPLEQLVRRIAYLDPGTKIAYVTDTIFNDEVVAAVAELAENADLLICEATFREEDAASAERYHHLTARQAGILAREAGVKRLLLNHPSRRYHGHFGGLVAEARSTFPRASLVGHRGERIIL